MKTIKKDIIEMIKNLPDESDYDDIMSEIYFRQRVDKSLKQIEEGKIITHDPDIRELVYQNYRIVYEISNHIIYIALVIHGSHKLPAVMRG